jgi:hypothetical protein
MTWKGPDGGLQDVPPPGPVPAPDPADREKQGRIHRLKPANDGARFGPSGSSLKDKHFRQPATMRDRSEKETGHDYANRTAQHHLWPITLCRD